MACALQLVLQASLLKKDSILLLSQTLLKGKSYIKEYFKIMLVYLIKTVY